MRKVILASWIALLLFLSVPLSVSAKPQDDLAKEDAGIVSAIQAAESGNIQQATKLFESFQINWLSYEDGIKEISLAAYQKIEGAMGEASLQTMKQPVDAQKLAAKLKDLHTLNSYFVEGNLSAFGASAKSDSNVTAASLVTLLEKALDQVNQKDIAGASESIQTLRNSWLLIEGIVLTQSSAVYTSMERDMVTAYAQLSASPPQIADAAVTITRMHVDLQPLASKTSYTMLDATTIILREGLEALLVIIALLGFLKKAGHEDKKRWIWFGVYGGLSSAWRWALWFNSYSRRVLLGITIF